MTQWEERINQFIPNARIGYIRGPKIDSSEEALNGFLNSNNLEIKDVYKKETQKGIFYFTKIDNLFQNYLKINQKFV